MPNGKRLYGSATTVVPTQGIMKDNGCHTSSNKKFHQVIYITKTHIKALDQPTQRCNQENANVNTSACIARFIEKHLECNAMNLGSRYLGKPPCTTYSQLQGFANMSRLFEQTDGNDIYEMTGCLSSCEKDSFSLSAEPIIIESTYTSYEKCQVYLEFIMLESSYKEEEQYVIYEVGSFIADVGGYMGLLLGGSLLSLYMAMETYMRKLLSRSCRGKIDV